MFRPLRVAIVSVALAISSLAAADEKTSAEWFSDGQRLTEEGKYKEACAAFEQALSMHAAVGTKFNLAACYEKVNRLASAQKLYREVESVTNQVGQRERAAIARERADALEPRVATLVVTAPWQASEPDASFVLDGQKLAPAELGSRIKVDPGEHVALARFRDGTETRATVMVDGEGAQKSLVLPAPDSPRHGGSAPVATPPARSRMPATLGLIVGGAGVVSLAVGTAILISAKGKYDDATATCGLRCPKAEADEANHARASANIGTVFGGAGVALGIGGLILWFMAPKHESKAAWSVVPVTDGTHFGVGATGRL